MLTRRPHLWRIAMLGWCLAMPTWAWAQTAGRPGTWQPDSLLMSIVSTLIFGLIGVVIAIIGFKLFDAVTPFNLEQEICEKQNMAVAALCAGVVLGICLIVAAAVL